MGVVVVPYLLFDLFVALLFFSLPVGSGLGPSGHTVAVKSSWLSFFGLLRKPRQTKAKAKKQSCVLVSRSSVPGSTVIGTRSCHGDL